MVQGKSVSIFSLQVLLFNYDNVSLNVQYA